MERLLPLFGVTLAAGLCFGQAPGLGPPSSKPALERLLTRLHEDHREEMRAGLLASDRADDLRVKRFGRRLARDLRIADRRLLELARKRGYQVRARTPPVERPLDPLAGFRGRKFDRAFVDAIEARRLRALARLEAARSAVADPAVRRYLDDAIPLLRQHRMLAAKLRETPPIRTQ